MKLYELTESYFNLLNVLEQDVEQEHVEEALAMLDDEFDTKAENIAKVLKTLEASREALKNEKQRINTRQKSIEKNIDNLKSYLYQNMKNLNKKKVKSDLFNINIRKNPPKLVIKNERDIPDAYWVEQPPKLDRRMLLEDLKNEEFPDFKGARIEQGESLSIN